MTDRYQILHITDMHLLGDVDARLHGWHVQQAFDAVLADALARYPDFDLIVLGGDLVDDESVAGYERLNARLATLDRPVLAMAGNHDDPDRIARLLTHAQVHTDITLGGWRLYALNTHVAGSDAGRIGDAQRAELKRRLDRYREPSIVFAHHPPVTTGSAWLDAIGLEDRRELAHLLADYPQVRGVVCGHAHQCAQQSLGAIDCWITPSTMRQFLPRSTQFADDPDGMPGYRMLTLEPDGTLSGKTIRVRSATQACG